MPALGDVWEVALHQRLYQQELVNTFGFQIMALGAATTDQQIADLLIGPQVGSWAELFTGLVKAIQSTELTHVRRVAQRVDPGESPVYERIVNLPGVLPDPAGFSNTALCISRRGDSTGRRKYGRIAVGGIPSTQCDSGFWNAGILAAGENIKPLMINTFTPQASTTTFTVGFWSSGYRQPPLPNLIPLFVPCLSAVVRGTTRVQRSRTIGVGQ